MDTTLLIVHMVIAAALIGVILLQQSEGGVLGMGSNPGAGLFSVRGTANALTRITAVLATLFIAVSLLMSIVSRTGMEPEADLFEATPPTEVPVDSGQAVPLAQ